MNEPESPTRHRIIGSIGHVDHSLQSGRRLGKSAAFATAAALGFKREKPRLQAIDTNLELIETRLAASEIRGWLGQPKWSDEEKDLAHKLDPECWVSYSGKNREFKRGMDRRRLAALNKAAHDLAKE